MKYFQLHKKFLIEEGKSVMNLTKIIEFCGMKDERIRITEGDIEKQGKPHNALEDAKLEAECVSRILYGKSLFEEYKKFKIPAHRNIKKV
jgi:hypothetical protein